MCKDCRHWAKKKLEHEWPDNAVGICHFRTVQSLKPYTREDVNCDNYGKK